MKKNTRSIFFWAFGGAIFVWLGIALFDHDLFYAVTSGAKDLFSSTISQTIEVFKRREELRSFINGFGPWAPFVFISLQALQVILSPIPGEATGLIGGFIFGIPAFFYSTVGLSLGSFGAFMLARTFRRFIRTWVEKSEAYNRLEHILEHQGLFITFLLFVFPGFPKDLLCYFLGLSKMPWEVFLLICTIGRMPGTLMLTFQGADLFEGRFLRLAVVTTLAILVTIPMYLKREALYAWVEKRTQDSTEHGQKD